MTTYQPTPCGFCGTVFQRVASRHQHCTPECRFKALAAKFAGNGCWRWPLSFNVNTGYGQFCVSTRPHRLESAHRMAFEVFNGPLIAGKYVCHRCDNRWCFNPAHLYQGSAAENTADMIRKGRHLVPRNLTRGDDHWTRREPERAAAVAKQNAKRRAAA